VGRRVKGEVEELTFFICSQPLSSVVAAACSSAAFLFELIYLTFYFSLFRFGFGHFSGEQRRNQLSYISPEHNLFLLSLEKSCANESRSREKNTCLT
jgi:hypothetical protein